MEGSINESSRLIAPMLSEGSTHGHAVEEVAVKEVQACDTVKELSEAVTRSITLARSETKRTKRLQAKRSIVKHGPLRTKASKQSSESQTFESKRATLLEHLEKVKALPKNSAYARHRKLTLEKALALLDKSR